MMVVDMASDLKLPALVPEKVALDAQPPPQAELQVLVASEQVLLLLLDQHQHPQHIGPFQGHPLFPEQIKPFSCCKKYGGE